MRKPHWLESGSPLCAHSDFMVLRKRLKVQESAAAREEAKLYSNMFKGFGDAAKPAVVPAEA